MKFVYVQIKRLDDFRVKIIGKINAISTSKIKKMIAIRKNRIEKGSREEFIGLNPHSNGESFSRSAIFFLPRIVERAITIKAIMKIIQAMINKFKIIYIKIF